MSLNNVARKEWKTRLDVGAKIHFFKIKIFYVKEYDMYSFIIHYEQNRIEYTL